MNIVVVFPYNNIFSSVATKPVVLAGLPYITNSSHKITVISRFTETPINHNSLLLTPKNTSKKNYFQEVLNLINTIEKIDLIEVHQDLKLSVFLSKKTQKKTSLIKHGAYLINRFKEQFFLYRKIIELKYLKYINSVYCISHHVCSSLKKKYSKYSNKFFVSYNTYGHIPNKMLKSINFLEKKNIICYAGKPTKYKGFFEILKLINDILQNNKNYKIVFMLSFFNENLKQQIKLDSFLKKNFYHHFKSKRLEVLYNLSNKDVFKQLKKSKILLVPTITEEPFGLIALEGYLAGCTVISSNNGGLNEIAEDKGIYFDYIYNQKQNYKTINNVINSYSNILTLTKETREFIIDKFNPIKNVKILDKHRSSIK